MSTQNRTAKKIPKPQAFTNDENENKNTGVNEEEQVIEAFKTFDIDGDGTISVREFIAMLKNFSSNLSEYDINDIIKESKVDVKGTMDYREFVDFWRRMGN